MSISAKKNVTLRRRLCCQMVRHRQLGNLLSILSTATIFYSFRAFASNVELHVVQTFSKTSRRSPSFNLEKNGEHISTSSMKYKNILYFRIMIDNISRPICCWNKEMTSSRIAEASANACASRKEESPKSFLQIHVLSFLSRTYREEYDVRSPGLVGFTISCKFPSQRPVGLRRTTVYLTLRK